ncbi:callose synthase 12-like protein [Tanacetum coccineum]
MQLQLSSVFYTFSLGTRSHYFGRTILHGCAKYRATGRGFVVEHKKFAENYRLYARSHFIKAIELGLILTVYAAYSPVAKGTFTYIALTISSWLGFMDHGTFWGVFAKSEESWEKWWYEEQDHLRTTGLFGKLFEIILDLRFFFFQYGIVYQLGIAAHSKSIVVYILSWIYVVVALGIYSVVVYARDKYSAREHIYYRLVQFLVVVLNILIIVGLLEFTQFKFIDIFTSLLAFIPTGWGCLLIAQVFRPILEKTMLWGTVVSVARTYDTLFGMIVLTPVAVLSWLPGFQSMQTRILFNEAFSRGLRIFQIVNGKKSKSLKLDSRHDLR